MKYQDEIEYVYSDTDSAESTKSSYQTFRKNKKYAIEYVYLDTDNIKNIFCVNFILLHFTLPSGSYASIMIHELEKTL